MAEPKVAPAPETPSRTTARRRGRRPGGEDTRATIVASARTLFLAEGYDRVSMRAIARHAGVDPALVHHYFDGKPDLFLTSVITHRLNPGRELDPLASLPREQLGAALVETFLHIWDGSDAGGSFRSMLQVAMSADDGVRPFREFLAAEVLSRFPVTSPDPAEAARRKQLVASQMLGMALARYVLLLPWFANASHQELAATIGPTIQRYLDGA